MTHDPKARVHKAFFIAWCENMQKQLKLLRSMVEEL